METIEIHKMVEEKILSKIEEDPVIEDNTHPPGVTLRFADALYTEDIELILLHAKANNLRVGFNTDFEALLTVDIFDASAL